PGGRNRTPYGTRTVRTLLLLVRSTRAAEHVGVPVVDFQRQGVDGHRVHAAALGAPPLVLRIPRAVLAAVLRRVLVRNQRVLHRLVPLLPHRAFGSVELEQRQGRIVP